MDKLKFNYKFDIYLFIISIFLQCFAIIKTNKFGISLSTIVVLYLVIKYKLFIREKYNIKFIIFNIILITSTMISFLLNQLNIDYLKVFRLEMIIFLIYFSIKYIKIIHIINGMNYFMNVMKKITIMICVYGIYEHIACMYDMPLFLNVLKNNPSYLIGRHVLLYSVGGGWIKYRICTAFVEPSFYAIFIDILYFILNFNKDFKENIIINILLISNLILTFSRSGQTIYIYIIIMYNVFKIVKKINTLTKLMYLLTIMMPIMNIYILDFVNKRVFNDLSSKARTNSVVYYLNNTFDNKIKCFLGHGYGIIQKNYKYIAYKANINNIESFAHNGYVEILYEVGILTLIFIIIFILNMIARNIINKDYRYLIFLIITNINDFGTEYNIESISITLSVLAALMLVDGINTKNKNEKLYYKLYNLS